MPRLLLSVLVLAAFTTSGFADVNSTTTACHNRVDAGLIQGAVIGVISGTESDIILCGDASSDREEFELGSISKSFAGIALAKLSLEGKIDLEAPISIYVHELAGSYMGTVTAHQLATHSARLVRSYSDAQHTSAWLYDESELIGFLKAYVPDAKLFPPGSRTYSNVGFGALGLVLSRVEKQAVANVLKMEVLEPLGLTDTDFVASASKPDGLAQGYDVLLRPVGYSPVSDLAIAAGGVFSDLHDMMIFLQANLHPDQSELGRAMSLSHILGLGWDSLPGKLPTWKNGSMSDGFATTIDFDPTQGIGTVVLGNEFNSPSISALGSIAMGKPDLSHQIKLDADFIDSAVGAYSTADQLVEIDVIPTHVDYLGVLIKGRAGHASGRLLSLPGSDDRFGVDYDSTSGDRVELSLDPVTQKMGLTYFEYVNDDANDEPIYRIRFLTRQAGTQIERR